MAIAKDYYAYVVANAKQAAALKKKALDQALTAMTTAQFDKSGKFTGYAKSKTGAPQMGTLDVQHEQGKKNIQASGEAAGMLQSGQQAERLSSEEAAWRSGVVGAIANTATQKGQVTTDLAQQLAQYQATYGKPVSSGGVSNTQTINLPPGTTNGPGQLGIITPPPVSPFGGNSTSQNNRITSRNYSPDSYSSSRSRRKFVKPGATSRSDFVG
jgi:hypothetical protein